MQLSPGEIALAAWRCCTYVIGAYLGGCMSIDLKELRSLPIAEKLRLVELLWDDIGASDEPIVLHPWQATEVARRSSELKADSSIAISREEFWLRVDG